MSITDELSQRSPETILKLINRYKEHLITDVSHFLVYGCWQYSKDGLKESHQAIIDFIFDGKLITDEEITSLSDEQLKELGITECTDKDDPYVWVFPLSLLPIMEYQFDDGNDGYDPLGE